MSVEITDLCSPKKSETYDFEMYKLWINSSHFTPHQILCVFKSLWWGMKVGEELVSHRSFSSFSRSPACIVFSLSLELETIAREQDRRETIIIGKFMKLSDVVYLSSHTHISHSRYYATETFHVESECCSAKWTWLARQRDLVWQNAESVAFFIIASHSTVELIVYNDDLNPNEVGTFPI